jgi:hypothetical protein
MVAFSLAKIADPLERDAEGALKFFVVLVGVGKTTADSKTFFVGGECSNWIDMTHSDVCKLVQVR